MCLFRLSKDLKELIREIMAMKRVKRFPGIVISFSYLKDSASTAVKRDTVVLTRYVKGVPFGSGRYTKEVPFLSKMVCKTGEGLDLGAEPLRIKLC